MDGSIRSIQNKYSLYYKNKSYQISFLFITVPYFLIFMTQKITEDFKGLVGISYTTLFTYNHWKHAHIIIWWTTIYYSVNFLFLLTQKFWIYIFG